MNVSWSKSLLLMGMLVTATCYCLSPPDKRHNELGVMGGGSPGRCSHFGFYDSTSSRLDFVYFANEWVNCFGSSAQSVTFHWAESICCKTN